MTLAFDNLEQFLAMGKHGVYVWCAWSIVSFALAGLVWLSRRSRKGVEQRIRMQIKRMQGRELNSMNEKQSDRV